MRMVLALVLALATSAATQAAQSPASTGAGAADQAPVEPIIDASKLGVSLSRIQRGLRQTETREVATGNPLRIEYQVQVFGAAPRIDALGDFDIGPGAPLSYGAPTHNDFLNQWTPQAYRSPPLPISSLAGWALFQLVKRADKSKCEQEIAEYRALVMQGVSAAAPRCTQ
ncbi:MAG TPA: hypothetical protein PLH72_18015 [Vicinamibacterales bacterium]|nr:hypothetical protein [Vicinamibacterales bacterium]